MSTDGSTIELIYDVGGADELDVANHAVIDSATFSSASNANPGEMEVVLRDPDRVLSFITGKRCKLRIDDQDMWSGFVIQKTQGSFFPAGDGRETTKARRFTLRGIDNNLLLDKRVLRRTANYLKAIPNITTDTYDGALLRTALSSYFDMPSWLDISTYVDDVTYPAGGSITSTAPWAWPQQGSKLRALCEDLSRWSAAVYYIGPDDAVHYHAIQDRECSWGFSDRPNHAPISSEFGFDGAYTGFRELSADEDGSQLATDALVWGGSAFAGDGQTVFKRATDSALELIHGKWQMSETHFNETNYKLQKGVDQRANMIVFGNPTGTGGGSEPGSVVGEGPRGLRFSQWAYGFGWTTKDVPLLTGVRRHLYPGDIVPIQLWSFSEDGGTTPFTKYLPLRSLKIAFAGAKDGKAHVKFFGGFDLRNEDSKYLWKYLRNRAPQITTIAIASVTDDSTDPVTGGFGQFAATPAPDGVTTVFAVKFPYIAGTLNVYLNGLLQRSGIDFTESDPDAGEFTMTSVPYSDDTIYATCRTQ